MPYKNTPIYVEESPGTKHYCTCGESSAKPYCDGTHAELNTGKSPQKCEITENKRVAICDCGHTGNPPFCDGAHTKL